MSGMFKCHLRPFHNGPDNHARNNISTLSYIKFRQNIQKTKVSIIKTHDYIRRADIGISFYLHQLTLCASDTMSGFYFRCYTCVSSRYFPTHCQKACFSDQTHPQSGLCLIRFYICFKPILDSAGSAVTMLWRPHRGSQQTLLGQQNTSQWLIQ